MAPTGATPMLRVHAPMARPRSCSATFSCINVMYNVSTHIAQAVARVSIAT